MPPPNHSQARTRVLHAPGGKRAFAHAAAASLGARARGGGGRRRQPLEEFPCDVEELHERGARRVVRRRRVRADGIEDAVDAPQPEIDELCLAVGGGGGAGVPAAAQRPVNLKPPVSPPPSPCVSRNLAFVSVTRRAYTRILV